MMSRKLTTVLKMHFFFYINKDLDYVHSFYNDLWGLQKGL